MCAKQNSDRPPIQSSNWPISQLPGLSDRDRSQLEALGINSTLSLLKTANSSDRKQALANNLQIHIQYVNKWVALADLSRIPSVGCEYCGLLLHAGIASVKQVAQIPIHRLHQQIMRLHLATMQNKDLCPSIEIVQTWIQQAKIIDN